MVDESASEDTSPDPCRVISSAPSFVLGVCTYIEVVGCWGVFPRLEEEPCCSLLVTAVSVHVVPWVRALVAVIYLQQRARGAAFQLFPLHPSRKLIKAMLEAGACGEAVVVLEAGRARSQPEQAGLCLMRHLRSF